MQMNPIIMENFLPIVVNKAPMIGADIIYVNENTLQRGQQGRGELT